MLIRTGDYRINQHHPILFNVLHSLPIALNVDFVSEDLTSTNWIEAKKDDIASDLVNLNGGKVNYSLTFLVDARLVASALSAILLFVIYQLLYRYFGLIKAGISTLLLAFSPTLIAHSGLVTTDVPAMYMIFIASLALYSDLKSTKKNPKHFPIFFIVSAFIAIISKYTATLLLPFWILIYIFVAYKYYKEGILQIIKQVATIIAAIILLLTAAYGFRFSTIFDADYNNPGKIEATYDHLYTIDRIVPFNNIEFLNWVYRDIKFPFPEYLKGFYDNVVKHNFHGHKTYLLGKSSNGGNPLYFPVAFITKETIPFVFISLFSVIYVFSLLRRNKEHFLQGRAEYLPLLITPIILTLLSLSSSINIGIRHLLPIYPFLTLAVAYTITELYKRYKQYRWYIPFISILILAHVLLSATHFPNYIGYFNQIVGKEEYNYLYLQDSNFDWGQEDHLADIERERIKDTSLIVQPKESISTNIKAIETWEVCLRYRYFSGDIKPVKSIGKNFLEFDIPDKKELCNF